MDCSVCGQPGATKCLAVDEHGNPIGEWVHAFCAPQVSVGTETQGLARAGSVFRGQKVIVPGMRIKRGQVVQRLEGGMFRMQRTGGKLHRL